MNPSTRDRISGCLNGLAAGDAIGKQTETLSFAAVRQWYPEGVRGFEGLPGTVMPRYAGNRKHAWRFGETTDDTERTIAVARAILRDRDVRHASVGRELLGCRKCIHPGIASLWEFHQAGDPARVADRHDGCGAAVRAAPVGILYRSSQLDAIVAGACEASIPTHGGPLALAAAAANAAAVSAALDGGSAAEVVDLACEAAARAERLRTASDATTVADAIRTIHGDLCTWTEFDPAGIAARYFPDGPLTIVPLALALATVLDSAEAAILLAANIGGDSDSVASVAGAVLGARFPDTVNGQWKAVVERVNAHGLATIADGLARLRRVR